jgi:hypothetical protein
MKPSVNAAGSIERRRPVSPSRSGHPGSEHPACDLQVPTLFWYVITDWQLRTGFRDRLR